jgi:isocitrate dehydrogenase kinase/phosphatase
MTRGLELLIAQTILQGFDAQYGRFLEVTSGAQQRFEQADWHAVQQAMKQRIHLYDHHVGLVVEQLRCITDGKNTDAEFLLRVKEHYTQLLPDYPRFESPIQKLPASLLPTLALMQSVYADADLHQKK